MKKYAIYIRVSTQKQGESGLGLESQRKICLDFVAANKGEFAKEFMDVESGTHRDRRGLAAAIAFCKENDCALVIAKLDRLARDVEFCFKVINTGVEIHFCDMPQINTLLLGVFASVAQYERELISERTKKALAAKKERGEWLGGKSLAWIESYNRKSYKQRSDEHKKSGKTKNERFVGSKETQAFLKVLKNVFPDACKDENAANWSWKEINTKGDNKDKVLALMKDYRDLDDSGTLFRKWNFEDDRVKLQVKLATQIRNIKQSMKTYNNN